MTLSPDYWTFYLPGSAAAFLPAPPEHPDTGGNTYTLGGGALDEHLADYLARFPDTVGLPN